MGLTHSNYKLTTLSCFVGIFVQAIINNLTAILFIPLMELYGFSYAHLGILVGINFSTQVASDIIFSKVIDRVGFRKLILPTTLIAFIGLVLFALSPYLFDQVFIGILLATMIFAASSGLLEVLLSPLVNAIPGDDKGPAMSLMHSFYAWGQVATIVVTTLFIFFFGGLYWQIIIFIWSIFPLINFFMFLRSPFPENIAEEHRLEMRDLLFKPFYLLALAAIFFGGATEVVMNQWSSTFMEKALALPKITGDLLGMCGFALLLGVGRALYGLYGHTLSIQKVLLTGSACSILCYLIVSLSPFNVLNLLACGLCGLTASLLWPGTLIITSDHFPLAGAWMFAILAAAGDIGAAFGPWLTGEIVHTFLGFTTESSAIRIGILFATLFPVGATLCHLLLIKMHHTHS